MGCWNATDYISKLPIYYGEKIVIILVRKAFNELRHKCPRECYPTDAYVPFGYPIYGKYDDYGGIEKIDNVEDVIEYINTVKIYDCDNKRVIITKDNLESCINNMLSSGYSVGEERFPIEGFFVFRDLYELLIKEISSRKRYNKNETIAHQFERLLEKNIKGFRESERYLSLIDECDNDEDKDTYTFGLMSFHELSRFGMLSSFTDMPWDISSYIKLKLIKSYDKKLASSLTDMIMFKTALDALRMGYFCITGDGSQSREMYIHTLVAKYILKHTSESYKTYLEENDERMTKREYLSETLYGYYEED